LVISKFLLWFIFLGVFGKSWISPLENYLEELSTQRIPSNLHAFRRITSSNVPSKLTHGKNDILLACYRFLKDFCSKIQITTKHIETGRMEESRGRKFVFIELMNQHDYHVPGAGGITMEILRFWMDGRGITSSLFFINQLVMVLLKKVRLNLISISKTQKMAKRRYTCCVNMPCLFLLMKWRMKIQLKKSPRNFLCRYCYLFSDFHRIKI